MWAHPDLFELDDNLMPHSVAGVPPDAFSDDGQLWGNPIYDYAPMRADGFAWWRSRIAQSFAQCDGAAYRPLPRVPQLLCGCHSPSPNARVGEWRAGGGMAMLDALNLKDMPIIAEDLGDLGEDVHKFVRDTGLPNMKVLQFAFDSNRRKRVFAAQLR